MTAEDFFIEQAKSNKWLKQLEPHEVFHFVDMLHDFAIDQIKIDRERVIEHAEGEALRDDSYNVYDFVIVPESVRNTPIEIS